MISGSEKKDQVWLCQMNKDNILDPFYFTQCPNCHMPQLRAWQSCGRSCDVKKAKGNLYNKESNVRGHIQTVPTGVQV